MKKLILTLPLALLAFSTSAVAGPSISSLAQNVCTITIKGVFYPSGTISETNSYSAAAVYVNNRLLVNYPLQPGDYWNTWEDEVSRIDHELELTCRIGVSANPDPGGSPFRRCGRVVISKHNPPLGITVIRTLDCRTVIAS